MVPWSAAETFRGTSRAILRDGTAINRRAGNPALA
jgi:hypothetical protein